MLVNVGYDESMGMTMGGHGDTPHANSNAPPLVLPQVDAVLLTDSSLHAIGGLPRYFGSTHTTTSTSAVATKRPPIYATFPTVKMGQMNLYDHHANISLDGGNPGYSLSDVDTLFSPFVDLHLQQPDVSLINANGDGDAEDPNSIKGGGGPSTPTPTQIQTMKYAQTIIINDPTTNKPAIAITPQRAGHLTGASYYTLKRLTDETEVVVAPIYHHAKEKHLDSSTLYKYATACDVLITTCGGPGAALGSLYIPNSRNTAHNNHNNNKPILNPPSVGRDEGELVETILSTLRRGGNVLLPTDASGRVLELLYLLNQHWERHRLGSAYNLCWVGSMVHNTIAFARSQLEWMAEPLGAQFDSGRGHPFALKSVQMFSTVAELEATCCLNGGDAAAAAGNNSNPTCVLASGATLDHGPARDLFLKWSENADNAIILTDSRRCVERGSVLHKGDSVGVSGVAGGAGEKLAAGTSPSKDAFAAASLNVNGNVTAMASGGETPNIVQEDEETAGAINIGTAMTMDRMSDYSTAGQLMVKWCEAKAAREEMADIVECDVMIPKRSPLAGAELKTFLAQEEAKRLKEKAAEERRAMLREVELAKGRLRLHEEEASGAASAKSSGASAATKKSNDGLAQETSTTRPKKKSRFDANLFLKYSKPCHSKS